MPARLSSLFIARVALPCACLVASAPARAADATPRFVAITAYEEGRFEDALTALEAGATCTANSADAPSARADPELCYLRARALAELGRFGEALDALAAPDPSFPVDVQSEIHAQRRHWASRAGRCNAVEASHDTSRDGLHLLARCASAAGNFARVKQLLAKADDLEGRMLYAMALFELGETDDARPLARALYIEAPGHALVARLTKFLADPDGKVSLSSDERLARAEALIAARRPDEALTELEGVRDAGPKERRAKLHHVRGDALFRLRTRYADAAKAYRRAAQLGGPTAAYDAFRAIRSQSRAGDDAAAIKGYRDFAKRYPKSHLVADALYLSAWLSARQGLPGAPAALSAFVSSAAAKSARGLRRDALWDLAWMALDGGDAREAETWLERYAEAADRPMEKARAAYWRGRAATLRKRGVQAREHYRAAQGHDPLGYYAQLSARRLRALGEEPSGPFVASGVGFERPELAVPPGVLFYARLGLVDDAARLAEPWLKSLPDRRSQVAGLLNARSTSRVFAAAEPLMNEVLTTHPKGPARWLWQALLPRPYPEVMQAEALRHGVDVDEVYGHMQVESRYQPRAISGANALGLLQLLPQTATAVAKERGLELKPAMILVPSINITLGITFLAGLIRENRDLPQAIAAYNAGGQRVREWLGPTEQKKLDVWVEEIPIEQTRNYVRRVISAWSRYRAFSHPDDPWGLPLPDYVGMRTD